VQSAAIDKVLSIWSALINKLAHKAVGGVFAGTGCARFAVATNISISNLVNSDLIFFFCTARIIVYRLINQNDIVLYLLFNSAWIKNMNPAF